MRIAPHVMHDAVHLSRPPGPAPGTSAPGSHALIVERKLT
jgi:hypothetical protein